MFFVTWALIFSFVSFVVGETARIRDLFINYALVAYICALASAHLYNTLVWFLYIAAFCFVTYVFYKEGKSDYSNLSNCVNLFVQRSFKLRQERKENEFRLVLGSFRGVCLWFCRFVS